MTDDHFAFRGHSDFQIDRDFTMQSHRNSIFANALQRLAQVNAMTIDLVATLSERLRHVHRSNRSVKESLLAGFSLELELERAHLFALCFRTRALLRFLLQQRRAFGFNSLDVARGRFNCEAAWQKVVAGIARSNSDNLTTRAEIVNIFAQKYFRVSHLVLPLVGRVRKERDISRALDRFRQHALVRCTVAGDSSRQDLPAFGQVILKQPHVLEIDKVYFVDTEPANAPAVHTATTAAAAAHWPSIAVVIGIVTTATTALAVFIIGCHYIYPLQRFHSPEANLFAGSFGKLHRWSTTPVLTRRGTLRSFTSATILQLVRTPAIFIHAHRDVAQHAIVNAHAALKLGNLLARALDLDQHKRTVFVVQDFISELALAHRL